MWKSATIRWWLRALLLVQAFAMAAAAQTADSKNEFWPEFDVYLKLNEKSRLFFMYTATRPESIESYTDGQVGLHFDYWAGKVLRKRLISYVDQSKSKPLMVRGGYLISRPKNNSGTATEHMATAEATGRAQLLGGLLLGDRNRADLRWVNGDPGHRYRNRLKLERTFDIWKFQLTPYAHAEVFYDFGERRWTRLRYSAGAEWNVTKRIIVEGYYLRQNTWASVPQFVNAFGLAFQFYLR